MNTKSYTPHKLKNLVLSIWEQKADMSGGWKILPSGFVELIFMLGPSMKITQGKLVSEEFNPTKNFCFLSGLHTKPLSLMFSNFHVMGVQMHPIAVKAIFGIPCLEVKDWAIPAEHILTDLAKIEDHIFCEGSFLSKAKWLEDYLLNKIQEKSELSTAFKILGVIDHAKKQLYFGNRIKIEEFSGYSRMHTHKLFTDWFGLAPSRTMRLQQFIDSLKLYQNKNLRLTDIALQTGFYDQAHYIRVFREFATMCPKEYKKCMTPLIGQFPI